MLNKKSVVKTISYTFLILFTLLFALTVRLYYKPLDLSFLRPHIIRALNNNADRHSVEVGSIKLELMRSLHPIRIIATDFKYERHDNSLVIISPKTALSFSFRAILRGVLTPGSVEMFNPSVKILAHYKINKKSDSSHINQKKLEYHISSLETFLDRFTSGNKSYPESYIDSISIKDARVEYNEVELERSVIFENADYVFERGYNSIKTSANASLMLEDAPVFLSTDIKYNIKDKKISWLNDIKNLPLQSVVNTFSSEKTPLKDNPLINARFDTLLNFQELLNHRSNVFENLDKIILSSKLAASAADNKIRAKIKAQSGSLNISVEDTTIEGISLKNGTIKLQSLALKEQSTAQISFSTAFSASDILSLADKYFANPLPSKVLGIRGSGNIDAFFDFPLKNKLKLKDIKADVNGELTNVVVPSLIEGKTLRSERLNLKSDSSKFTISGNSTIDGVATNLSWNGAFSFADERKTLNLSFKYDDRLRKSLAQDFYFLNHFHIKGSSNVSVNVVVDRKQNSRINIFSDLKNAELDYPFLGFYKKRGAAASVRINLRARGSRLVSISNFEFLTDESGLRARGSFNSQGDLSRIEVFEISGARTDAQAVLTFPKAGKGSIEINLSGNSYDLDGFFDELEAQDNAKPDRDSQDIFDRLRKTPNIKISASIDKVWTSDNASISNFSGDIIFVRGIGINEAHLSGSYDSAQSVVFKLNYIPKENNLFWLSILSNNAGETLRLLRVYDDISGGRLLLEGHFDLEKDIFVGFLNMKNFSVQRAPILTRVLTVASLSSLLRMLNGGGLLFNDLTVPFEYKDDIFTVSDAKTFGRVLAITARGTYDTHKDVIDIRGVISPIHGLDRLINRIPIIRNLLRGEGGTVFAMNYSVTGDIANPNVVVNPLSVITPGSVKRIRTRGIFAPQNCD